MGFFHPACRSAGASLLARRWEAYSRTMVGQVSRRAALTAGAAAAAGLLGACSGTPFSSGPRRWSGHLSTTHWPGHSPEWLVAAPLKGPPAGLVVVLHGHGGTARSAFEDGLLLQDHVEATGLAVVSVDGGDSYWHARSDGTDTGAMVTEDLLPLALRTVGLPVGTPPTLLGWSMGGFGALWLARSLGRARVRAVVAESAALWRTGGETPQGAYDDREDFDRHSVLGHVAALDRIPVRLDCGTSDPFISANRELASRLRTVTPTFDTGGHTTAYWRDHAGAQLRWVAARQPQR